MTKKMFYISVLNCMAAFAVVILHCNQAFWNYATGAGWTLTNFIETAFYWAVPIFFMNTGMTTMDYRKRYSTSRYFAKRILRIGVPFVAWSLVGMLMRWLQLRMQHVAPSMVPGTVEQVGQMSFAPMDILSAIIHTDYVNVYWFFIPMFIAYLVIPLLSLISERRRISIFSVIIVYEMLIYAVFPLWQKLSWDMGFSLPEPVAVLSYLLQGDFSRLGIPHSHGMLMFVLMGYCIGHTEFRKWQRCVIYICGILGWGMHFFGTQYLTRRMGMISQTFKDYENLPSLLLAVAVFLLVKTLLAEKNISVPVQKKQTIQEVHPTREQHQQTASSKRRNTMGWQPLIYKLSTYTFGIFLVHVYYNEGLPMVLNMDVASLRWIIMGPLLVFACSFATVWLLKKIPLIRYLVP